MLYSRLDSIIIYSPYQITHPFEFSINENQEKEKSNVDQIENHGSQSPSTSISIRTIPISSNSDQL